MVQLESQNIMTSPRVEIKNNIEQRTKEIVS